jgi:hypothetical protein
LTAVLIASTVPVNAAFRALADAVDDVAERLKLLVSQDDGRADGDDRRSGQDDRVG